MTRGNRRTFVILPHLWLATGCALALVAAPGSDAHALDMRPFCEVCRRYTDTSPSRVQAVIEIGKRKKGLDVCSVFCLCELLEDYEQEPLYSLVQDYASYAAEDDPLMLRADYAFFLYDATGDDQKSHEPYIYAFGSEDEAEDHQQELGGEVMDWSSVLEECTELAAEWEPEEQDRYTPLKKRGR